MDVLDVITIAVCGYGMLGCLAFVVLYHVLTGGHWRDHEVGWFLMVKAADFALILALIGATRLFGDWTGRRFSVLVLVAVFALHPWWWLRFVWHAHPRQVAAIQGEVSDMWRKYGQAIMSVVFTLGTAAYVFLNGGDNRIDTEEGVQLSIVVAQSLLVYVVPLASHIRWAKTGVELVLAGLLALASVIIDGFDVQTDGIVILLAVLSAAGVAAAPAVSDNGVGKRAAYDLAG